MSSSSLDYLELCRLCLVKDRVQAPIFEEDGDVNQIFLKIHACLPVKVSRDDKLPKKICDDCLYNVNAFYQFWNTTANAEKQLLQWLGEVEGLEDKQGYVTEVLDSNVMKQEHGSDNRLDGSVMQVSGHQNMDINMIENMSIITMPAGSEHQFTTVPIDTGGTVQTVQVSGPSTQTAHDQTGVTHLQEVEVDDDEDNMDDGCDNDDGLPVKEETDEGERSLEQTYVSLPCDEAGPSGLQQQKISEMSEITIQQTADGDPKTGYKLLKKLRQEYLCQHCSQQFPTEDLLALHVRSHTNKKYGCNFCGEPQVTHESLSRHLDKYHRDQCHVCDQCRRVFTLKMELTLHKRSHVNEKKGTKKKSGKKKKKGPYDCTVCDKKLTSQGYLNHHIKLRHGTSDSFKCELCDFSSAYKTNLSKHKKTTHILVKCEVCNESFDKFHLDAHMRTHSDVKPQVFCGKTVAAKRSLTAHERTHTGERPYECRLCEKVFKRESTLKAHVKTHVRNKGAKR